MSNSMSQIKCSEYNRLKESGMELSGMDGECNLVPYGDSISHFECTIHDCTVIIPKDVERPIHFFLEFVSTLMYEVDYYDQRDKFFDFIAGFKFTSAKPILDLLIECNKDNINTEEDNEENRENITNEFVSFTLSILKRYMYHDGFSQLV